MSVQKYFEGQYIWSATYIFPVVIILAELTGFRLLSVPRSLQLLHVWQRTDSDGQTTFAAMVRSSGSSLFTAPRVNAKHGKPAFSFYTPHVCNKLTENIRSAAIHIAHCTLAVILLSFYLVLVCFMLPCC